MYGVCCNQEGCTIDSLERHTAIIGQRWGDMRPDPLPETEVAVHVHWFDKDGNRQPDMGCDYRRPGENRRF